MTKLKQNPQELMAPLAKSIISIDHAGINLQVKENEIIITTEKNSPITITLHPNINRIDTSKSTLVFPSAKRTNKNNNEVLLQTFARLSEGLWYHLDVSIDEAKSLLKDAKEGTFLLRNSNHPSFIFTLSVATNVGVTSIRIGYLDGLFYLDCDERVRHKMPHFSDVVELVYFYSGRRLSGRDHSSIDDHRTRIESHPKCVWVDAKKRKYMPVPLTVPKLQSCPSLKHACRLRINSCIEHKCEQLEKKGFSVSADKYRNQLQIPEDLKDFLQCYPYAI